MNYLLDLANRTNVILKDANAGAVAVAGSGNKVAGVETNPTTGKKEVEERSAKDWLVAQRKKCK